MSSLPVFTATTTAEEAAAALAAQIRGKNVLITGTSINGIGFETARVIAQHANLVIITGYNQERLKLSEDAIKKENPKANIYRLTINLSSLASVRKAAAEVNALHEPLHVLINNAATAFKDFALTEDGIEQQYATNHVGPFLFTKLLIPKLLASASDTWTPRVVFVSSVAHGYGTGVDLEVFTAPEKGKHPESGHAAYRETKAANVLTAGELARRSKGKINCYSLNPGLIFTNAFGSDAAVAIFQQAGILDQEGAPVPSHDWKTIPQGASTTVVAAFDPRLNDKSGSYLDDCAIADKDVAAHAKDPAIAAKLWELTEKVIGEKFTL
ncbi:short-chain dehydrogenase/reductase family protein [Favolaschia claudopus]|uniref:Short-chain dehydrogenase/reductase family protein n=1 Tax=Favolaschia claudopus TaxID=2862362 RepID=A0AAW0EJE4_9AGAR